MNKKTILLNKALDALVLPERLTVSLPAHSELVVETTDPLTVTYQGLRYLIDDPSLIDPPLSLNTPRIKTLKEQVWEVLATCYDPEIPVNIVDLGLIYTVQLVPEQDSNRVEITMTLTSPGCPMGDFIMAEIKNKISSLPAVKEVEITLVFDPPWEQSRMSDRAKLELGLI